MIARLRQGPIGAQETSSIASMTKCARDRQCAFPPDAMLAMFQAALGHGQDAEIFNVQADYMFNVLRQPDTALSLWRRAIDLRPQEPQYRINLARVLIALGRYAEARDEIAALRRIGRVGANEQAARDLEARFNRQGRR